MPSRSFTVHDKSIRFGLGAVKGVGGAALESIEEVRREQPFTSLFDFCERVDLRKVNKKVVEALVKCGAFDSLGGKRAQNMEALEDAMEMGKRCSGRRPTARSPCSVPTKSLPAGVMATVNCRNWTNGRKRFCSV
jgi:DNA polymerase III alpha subunit